MVFALTINKVQVQSLKRVAIYLPRPAFRNGQIYVALCWATSISGITVEIVASEKVLTSTANVVNLEVIWESQAQFTK